MQGIKTGASPSGILTRHAGEDLRGRALSPHPLDRLSGGGGNHRRTLPPPPQTDPRSQIAKSYISQLSKMQSHAGGGGELDQRKFFKSRRSLQPISITTPTMLAKRDLRGSAPSFAPHRVTIRGDPSAPPPFWEAESAVLPARRQGNIWEDGIIAAAPTGALRAGSTNR